MLNCHENNVTIEKFVTVLKKRLNFLYEMFSYNKQSFNFGVHLRFLNAIHQEWSDLASN